MKFDTGALHIRQIVICDFRENRPKEGLPRFQLSVSSKTV